MPYSVRLLVDGILLAENEIPADYIDTSHDDFLVRLDPVTQAVENGWAYETTQIVVEVKRV